MLRGLALVVESRGYSLAVVHGLLIEVASLDAEDGALEHSLNTGLVAPGHVGSSWTSNQSRVSCISR